MARIVTLIVPQSLIVRMHLALANAHAARANAALRRWTLRLGRP